MKNLFADIPEKAVRTDASVVRTFPGENPFSECDIIYIDGVMSVWAVTSDGGLSYERTDEYLVWLETQPKTHRVTFEWTD